MHPTAAYTPRPMAFPTRFRGFFERTRPRYAPLLEEARVALARWPLPPACDEAAAYVLRDNPQPSFMLVPLMFLAMADASGGVTDAHREALPVVMMAMEVCAVLDDTVDHTARRSGRDTFPETFGAPAAASFCAALTASSLQRAHARAPALFAPFADLVGHLGAHQLWELRHRYPAPPDYARWLQNRYDEVTPAVRFALDGALLVAGRDPLPPAVCEAFARIFQDVDDVVNVVERREDVGENDDLKLGMVTLPIVRAAAADPGFAAALADFWDALRPGAALAAREQRDAIDRLCAQNAVRAGRLRGALLRHGVPATLDAIGADARRCVDATPPPYRALLDELVATFVDRVRVQSAA